ncbi:NACHT domain protein [Novipirellula aureliae]|uniref:NACHT domain protein n=1 Tax=Novipirellula aureliae TaxID=2527966 RepID=A0A5C6E4I1_9BACT|nr:hypothetical protein [Novipirellula aureliae]TWU43818.1 NACHT domain protein [Novipirellula aureliae]
MEISEGHDLISNPFCTRFVRPGAIPYRFDEAELPGTHGADSALDRMTTRVVQVRFSVIVGPHGSGKSTLLQTLLPNLQTAFCDFAKVHLIASQPCQRPIMEASNGLVSGGLLVVDGMEQLATWQRKFLLWRSKRRNHSILATAHRPLRGFEILQTTALSAQKIRELTKQRIASMSENTQQMILNELSNRPLGPETNLRELWFDLYDIAERMIALERRG